MIQTVVLLKCSIYDSLRKALFLHRKSQAEKRLLRVSLLVDREGGGGGGGGAVKLAYNSDGSGPEFLCSGYARLKRACSSRSTAFSTFRLCLAIHLLMWLAFFLAVLPDGSKPRRGGT